VTHEASSEVTSPATTEPRWNADGLIAAIAQHADTGEVLMLAWMNAQSLRLTLETGEAHYWSRSRNELWRKGATSGQLQAVQDVRLDCDGDAVLLQVRPGGDGGACHLGQRSCFHRPLELGGAEA